MLKMKFAVANVVQRTILNRNDLPVNIDTYNRWLEVDIENGDWNAPVSPVVVVRVREDYRSELNGCPTSYNGL